MSSRRAPRSVTRATSRARAARPSSPTSSTRGLTGTRASTIKGAPDIKPEQATETEGGFDAALLSSRMRFSATFYKKQITDLLLQAPIVPSTGFTTQYLNGGQITNRGTELELDVTPYQSGNRSWISGVTFSKQTGFVDFLPAGIAPFNPGVGSFSPRYGNAWIEAGKSTSMIQSTVGCSIALPTSGVCPAANRILGQGGDANPDFNMGFSNQLAYGPVRLTSLVEWRKGGDVVNLSNNYFDSSHLAADTTASNERLRLFNAAQHPYVEDAGFVKLREVTLAYEIPQPPRQHDLRRARTGGSPRAERPEPGDLDGLHRHGSRSVELRHRSRSDASRTSRRIRRAASSSSRSPPPSNRRVTCICGSTSLTLAGALGLAAGCVDDTIVSPENAPTVDALAGDLTSAGVQTLALGVLAQDRAFVRGDLTYYILTSIYARDAYRIDPNEPRYVSETLGGQADPGSFAGGGGWTNGFVTIRAANDLLAALPSAVETQTSPAQKNVVAGLAQTFKALEYWRLLELRDTIGIPIMPAQADSVPPLSCKSSVLAYTAAVLDSGLVALNAAGAATQLPFAPPTGLTAFGRNYRTAANLVLLNRGLKGKISLYRGLQHQNPTAGSFALAITELTQALGGAAPGSSAGIAVPDGRVRHVRRGRHGGRSQPDLRRARRGEPEGAGGAPGR